MYLNRRSRMNSTKTPPFVFVAMLIAVCAVGGSGAAQQSSLAASADPRGLVAAYSFDAGAGSTVADAFCLTDTHRCGASGPG